MDPSQVYVQSDFALFDCDHTDATNVAQLYEMRK